MQLVTFVKTLSVTSRRIVHQVLLTPASFPLPDDECRSMILTVWCVSVFPVCFRRPLSTSRQLIIIQEPGKSRKEDRVTNHILWTKVISTRWLCPQIWKVWLKIISLNLVTLCSFKWAFTPISPLKSFNCTFLFEYDNFHPFMNQMLSRNLISKVPLQVLHGTAKYKFNEYTNKSAVCSE